MSNTPEQNRCKSKCLARGEWRRWHQDSRAGMGHPEADVILFSHADSLNNTAWSLQFTSELADEFRLITYDLRGHSNSEKPVDEAQ